MTPRHRRIFDGLLKTVRTRYAYSIPASSGGRYLMDWRLAADGSSNNAAGGGWNAIDGDEDIAMALLMADRQWGSNGAWNYKQEGINTINAMKAFNMSADGTTLGLGIQGVSRTSDYMIGHFRAYQKATGDSFWNTAIDRSYTLIERMQNVYSPNAGLMPDFIVDTHTASPRPSPGGMGDRTNTEMHYFANAQRNPWRWGTDYLHSGDARWKGVITKMMNFFVSKNNGNPNNMSIGYQLSGADMGFAWPARGHIAGAMNGAQVDATYQPYLNAAWDWMTSHFTTSYYDAELSLLSMIVASGNWWIPTPSASSAPPPAPAPTPVPPPASKPSPAPAAPAPAPASGSGNRIQAENGTMAGMTSRNDVPGYEGSGFVGGFTKAGDKLTVNFAQVTAGTYDINIRYHAQSSQQNSVAVNGTARSESFAATGNAWAVKTVTGVALAAGANSVAIGKEWGWMDVDYIEIVASGAATQATTQTQAESGTLAGTGIAVRKDIAGYEGSGFVGGFTNNGDTLTLSFPNVMAGTYNLRIRYHSAGNQQNQVIINGKPRSESFAATGGGWAVKTISGITLAGGTHAVAIAKEWGWMDVDWIDLVPAGTGTRVTIKAQAESGTLAGTGVKKQTDIAGYEAAGFVGPFSNTGDTMSLSFPNVVAGSYNVRIRYHAWGAQLNQVLVNGKARSESFPVSNGWAVKTITGVALTGGTNTIAVSKEWGWISVDWIEITP